MNNTILELLPGFVSGCNTLHNALIGVTLVMCFCGILLMCNRAMQEQSLHSVWPFLVRIAVVVILVGSLGAFANLIATGVNELVGYLGATTPGGNVLQAYKQAVAEKFGSDSSPPSPSSVGDTTGASLDPMTGASVTPQSSSGFRITSYGYEKPGDPNYDSNSANGIGAFSFDSAPGSLGTIYGAAALSADVAQAYNVNPGQSFTVQTAQGPMNLVYADKTADWVTGAIDVYSPSGPVANDGIAVTGFTPGTNSAAKTAQWPLMGLGSKIMDSAWLGLLWPIVHLLNLLALAIMWWMSALQNILYYVEIAISPIFLGMMLIYALVPTATRFFCGLVAITLWPLGWAVADLLTRVIIGWAVNTSNNPLISFAGGGLGVDIGLFVVLASWVIFSSFAAPWWISRSIMGDGSSGLSAVMAATLGAGAIRAGSFAYRAAASAGMGAAGAAGRAAGSAPMSIASASQMNGSVQNFARRPTATKEEPRA